METNLVAYNLHRTYLAKYGAIELALAAMGLATAPILPIPAYIPVTTAAIAASMGSLHLLEFLANRKAREELNKSNFFNVDSAQVRTLRQLAIRHAMRGGKGKPSDVQQKDMFDNYYVGKGFPWTPTCMAFYERIKNDHKFSSLSDLSNVAGGRPFIHNLGNLGKGTISSQVLSLKEHTLIAGESGSGKTVLLNLLTSQFINDGETVCIIDPKGDKDLLNSVYSLCRAAGREKDFEFFSLSHPSKSASFNPMANALKSNDAANRITSIMEVGSNKTFVDFVWKVLNTVSENMLAANIPLTLKNIHRFSLLEMKNLQALCLGTHLELEDPAQRRVLEESMKRLALQVEHPGEHFSKMITSLEPLLTALATGETGALLSPEEGKEALSWETIIKEKKVVYFNLSSMIDSYTSFAVCKLLVQDLLSYVGQMYAYDNAVRRVKLVCDEIYSVVFKGLGDMLNKSRAAGLQALFGLQTDSDIAAQLNRDMVDVILGNLPNKIYLRIGQKNLAERFTDLFQEADFVDIQQMRSTSATPTMEESFFGGGSSARLQTRTQTIVTPEMVMGLPQGQAFVYNKGMAAQIAIPMLEQKSGINFFSDVLNVDYRLTRAQRIAPADRIRARGRYRAGAA